MDIYMFHYHKPKKRTDQPITCQCQERAVKRPESILKKVQCRKCGKIFRTNQEKELCFDCGKKS
ncbi:MAG: hypothetical protein LLF83_05745 [Methanobacterium sp.]|nr:hypothetical protein [Methanobacterium sp.]